MSCNYYPFQTAVFSFTANACLQNLPIFRNQGGGMTPRIDNDQQVIVPAYYFMCNSKVTQWGACFEPGGGMEDYEIDFQVWRPADPVSNIYTFVGMNSIRGDSGLDRSCLILDVPEEDQIQVQRDDVVGFHSIHRGRIDQSEDSKSPRDDAGVELDDGFNFIVWFADANMVPDCTEPGCTISTGPGNLDQSTLGAPVITAVVGK